MPEPDRYGDTITIFSRFRNDYLSAVPWLEPTPDSPGFPFCKELLEDLENWTVLSICL